MSACESSRTIRQTTHLLWQPQPMDQPLQPVLHFQSPKMIWIGKRLDRSKELLFPVPLIRMDLPSPRSLVENSAQSSECLVLKIQSHTSHTNLCNSILEHQTSTTSSMPSRHSHVRRLSMVTSNLLKAPMLRLSSRFSSRTYLQS